MVERQPLTFIFRFPPGEPAKNEKVSEIKNEHQGRGGVRWLRSSGTAANTSSA
jgi:hypothetical protein